MSSADREFYFATHSDPFYFLFLSGCYGRNSGTLLNESGEHGHPCLVPEMLEKKLSLLHHLVWGFNCGLDRCGLYYVEVCFLYTR